MADLNSVLNAVLPWVIGIIGIYLLYRPLKEPLNGLFRGIGNIFSYFKRKATGEEEGIHETLHYE